MAFNNEEILTLAKAGFTAQQIAALNMVGSAAPTVNTSVPTAPTGSVPASAPATMTPQPTTPAPVAPAAAPAPITAAPAAAPAPITAAPAAPAAPAATTDDILKAISGLSAQVTTGLIQTTSQPTPATAESILAEIINPPQKTTN